MNRPSASIKRTAPGSGSSRVLNIRATGSGFSSPDDLCKTLLPLLLLLCISRQSNIFKLRQHLFQCLLDTALQTGISNHTDPIQHIPLRQISVMEDKLLPLSSVISTGSSSTFAWQGCRATSTGHPLSGLLFSSGPLYTRMTRISPS